MWDSFVLPTKAFGFTTTQWAVSLFFLALLFASLRPKLTNSRVNLVCDTGRGSFSMNERIRITARKSAAGKGNPAGHIEFGEDKQQYDDGDAAFGNAEALQRNNKHGTKHGQGVATDGFTADIYDPVVPLPELADYIANNDL